MEKIPQIIKKVSPAVVGIILIKPNQEVSEKEQEEDGFLELETGSGFFVSEDGLIVTNRHVVFEVNGDYWAIWNGQRFYAEIINRDQINDAAIIRVKTNSKTPFLRLGDSKKLELGQTVIAIGNVLGGLQKTVSTGIISGLSRDILAKDESYNQTFELRGLIQTDAAINPGNSGGPLIDMNGQAIGINTASITGYENIGFAIPADLIKEDLENIRKYGVVKKIQLGIRYIILDANLSQKHDLPVDYGAYVLREPEPDGMGVLKNSLAEKAGIKEGDIILELNNQKITTKNNLKRILNSSGTNRELNLKILRNNQEISGKISLG